MTVLEAIRRSTEFLEKKGIESARLNAELLLADALHMPRMRLYLAFERVLTDAETEGLREKIVRRGRREPLQHIVGSTSFFGHEIQVTRDVLTPRPETEVLVEAAVEFLTTLESKGISRPVVLDIGTGSGCIAVALALKFPEAEIIGVDISPKALEIAAENARKNGLETRLKLMHSDLFSGLAHGSAFHLIVSNPPYIPSGEIQSLQPEVRDYDPLIALDGGADGLDFYRRLAFEAAGWLAPGGRLVVEFGDGQAEAIEKILRSQNWIVEAPREDYTRRLRVLAAHRANPDAP